MIYTVRYAHLAQLPGFIEGDVVRRGNIIAKMGNTGYSNGAHLHIDCVVGKHTKNWRLQDMADLAVIPAFKQLNYFIDDDLFNYEIIITTYFNDVTYKDSNGKAKTHLAYDVVPENRRVTDDFYSIFWNRSADGRVSGVGFSEGYGNYLLISYEA